MRVSGKEKPLVVIIFLVVGCIALFLFSSFWSSLLEYCFFGSTATESSVSVVSTIPIPEAFARTGLASTLLAGNSNDKRVNVDWSVSAVAGTGNIKLSWESSFSNVYYRVYVDDGSGFDLGIAVGSQLVYNFEGLEQGKEYVFKVAALDNDFQELSHVTLRAATEEQEVFPGDVVINEIAWMGTRASYNDEWIELYNNANNDLNLDGWLLVAEDGSPEIEIAGRIAAGGYFLLERTDDNTVSDIEADLIYTGALGNGGEYLKLVDSGRQVVDEVDCSEGWFAGDNDLKLSMERIWPENAGSSKINWMSNNSKVTFGKDADGSDILGTPLHENSIYGAEYVGEEDEEREIEFELPSSVRVDEPFTTTVRIKNFESDSFYYVKILAAEDENFYNARTLSADEKKWLAWNAAWADFPQLETDSSGDANFEVLARIKKESSPGEFKIKVRLRKVTDGVNIDSKEKNILVEPGLQSNVVLAATKLPKTAISKELQKLIGKVFICVGFALHLLLQSLKLR
ncbi:MAG: lamin tail domain-containing protein [Patescibacteria group bacterium]|nr:lamin tail domain-containing protein [Patescibacteria group bacterium]